MSSLKDICEGVPVDPLPEPKNRDESVPHAPVRTPDLTREEQRLALQNALRYFPPSVHETLAPEFADELRNYGHIYMYRFRPTLEMRAYPIDEYPVRCRQAAAIMHMIMNNLDPRVAQFPHELVTYGGNGQVFSNWAQFLLVMKYLSEMSDEQTLVLYSGHPMGLFPSSPDSPRAIITNGMVIPNYSSREMYEKMFALGVTMYGQMTAGSYCYIGPQGIVHGTTLTVLNAARNQLGSDNMAGRVFVTSGLGGMSGAQAKAAVICGCVGVIAEVCGEALYKRYNQGWLLEVTDDLDKCISMIRKAKREKRTTSIGYHGNVVDLWERLVVEYDQTGDLLADLGSDQTSCHNPYLGGYYPVQLSYEEARAEMHENPVRFKNLVQESLRRHVAAVNHLANKGLYFFDYGNAFLLEAGRAGADVGENAGLHGTFFRYPSYVQDIMGDIFSLGFGPFRWVCTSGDPSDLDTTDDIATTALEDIINQGDMAVQNAIGDSFRGATWVALHNGGGVGWGEVMNGGFGLVLDGSNDAEEKAKRMLSWDVSNGVARRSWSGNNKAKETICRIMDENPNMKVTIPNEVENKDILERALKD
ncbi:urocanate hydratase-like isoform X3 [Mercenaria mercenaria]|uniref:urocanate hydratase-like isoform X3 n=1 Tax=Mercenaria mercenaria TaxID=6596 RepID=UPI00234F4DF6|nr:urocanate hydratase-like isoform X3 [Mercenaria mercenaria]